MVDDGADAGRGLAALMSWWAVDASLAAYRAGDVAGLIAILRVGGAEASQVEAVLRR